MYHVLRVDTDRPYFSMTFDDGPDGALTPILIAALRELGARATFFVIGEKARRYPDLLRMIVDDGHEIGNHSYSHPYLLKLSDGDILRQIDRTQDAVFDACGALPKVSRAPLGRLNEEAWLESWRPITAGRARRRRCAWSSW